MRTNISNKIRSTSFCLLLSAFCFVIGCSHAPVTPYGDPDKLWEKVQENYDRAAGPFAAAGTICVSSPDFNHTVDFTLRWENSKRFRIDISGPFGISLASVGLKDSLAWVSVPLQGAYITGTLSQVDSTTSNLLSLSLERIIRAVEGLPPREAGRFQRAVKGKETTEFLFQSNDTSRTFVVEQRNGNITRYTVTVANKPWAGLEYGDFKPISGAARPHRITINSPAADMTLYLAFDSIKPAQSFSDEVWKQSVPEGATLQRFNDHR
ncbi:MAG: hypothetical protein QME74_10875 [Candidatus Edwardsbacteria bacterium]|nr:hypothetical protein [Candidatus Edwardsbacteria bacterium]